MTVSGSVVLSIKNGYTEIFGTDFYFPPGTKKKDGSVEYTGVFNESCSHTVILKVFEIAKEQIKNHEIRVVGANLELDKSMFNFK